MKTHRYHFIADNLDDVESIEQKLEEKGVVFAQTHVLSNDAVGVAQHTHLHAVNSLLRQDVIRSAQIGAIIGFVTATLIIVIAAGADLPQKTVGWVPYAFLAIVAFGFCIWEGGLLGMEEPNHQFRQFEPALAKGRHVFIVDVDLTQEHLLLEVIREHPTIVQHARTRGTSSWVFRGYARLLRFIDRHLLSQSQLH